MSEQIKNNSLNQDSAGSVYVNGGGVPVMANNFEVASEITIPESLEEYEYRKKVEAVTSASKAEMIAESKIREAKDRRKKLKTLVANKQQSVQSPINIQQQIQQQYTDENLQEIERLQSANNIIIPQEIDVIQQQDEVNDAINMIAPSDSVESADDLEVTLTNSGGQTKLKFSVNRKDVPSDFSLVAKMVKQFNSTIKPRPLDVRVIAAVNKNYGIKDKKERLSACSFSYKPTTGGVNKGTRVIIGKSEDYETTQNFIFFMQESRSKWIGTINSRKFTTREDYLIFIANAICDFYTLGFEVMQERLMFEKKGISGLTRVAEAVMKSGGYKCRLEKDGDVVNMIEITNTKGKNQWLHVYVMPGKFKDSYEIELMSKADSDWQTNINLGDTLSVNWLVDSLPEQLKNWYSKDWSADLNMQMNNDKYMVDKFDRIKMRQAFSEICSTRDRDSYVGITLKKALSVAETNEIMPGNYGAEVIIGKTDYLDYFVLTHLGYMIQESHSKSISPKTGLPHNNRKYMFQIEYSINGNKCIYRSFEFGDVLANTHFLTDNPVDASSISKF